MKKQLIKKRINNLKKMNRLFNMYQKTFRYDIKYPHGLNRQKKHKADAKKIKYFIIIVSY